MQDYDPFKQMKYKAFDESETTMITIAEFLILQFSENKVDSTKLKVLFKEMLKVCLLCSLNNIFSIFLID